MNISSQMKIELEGETNKIFLLETIELNLLISGRLAATIVAISLRLLLWLVTCQCRWNIIRLKIHLATWTTFFTRVCGKLPLV